jgi:hypothetical protein
LGNGERIETKPLFVMHNPSEVLNDRVLDKCIDVATKNGYTHLYSIKIDDDKVFLRGCNYLEKESIVEEEDEEFEELILEEEDEPVVKEQKTLKKSGVSVDEFRSRRKSWSLFGRK